MTSHLLRAATVLAMAAAAACGAPTDPQRRQRDLGRELQGIVDDAVSDHVEVPAVALAVHAPGLGLSWEGAAGAADPSSGEPMSPDHPVWIASNTKTFVAASVLRLWEEGKLDLDDPISAHLPSEYAEMLEEDGYRPDDISIRQLLTHTAGIYDHTESPNYADRIAADPRHRWTRSEQVAAAMAWGDPYGAPGEVFRYSDTGYVLLGGILERATGEPLSAAVRELAGFDRLGLRSTWWEIFEPRPAGVLAPAHQYGGDFDSYAVDGSIDLYGGGGLVATMGDLARFTRGLFTGAVYADPETLAVMLAPVDGASPGPGPSSPLTEPGVYRMGVFVVDVDGLTVYRHSGYWGTIASYAPELDVALAATVNQNDARAVLMDIERRALAILRRDG
jgi:D-alanyl-D-alanine carboxypeptidase